MFLVINTAESRKIIIALAKGNILISKSIIKLDRYGQAEKLLPAIDRLLKKNNIKPINLKGVLVVIGPGPFTSLRIGVITANTLGFALRIPVAGVKNEFKNLQELIKLGIKKLKKVKRGKFVLPFYGKEPNIT